MKSAAGARPMVLTLGLIKPILSIIRGNKKSSAKKQSAASLAGEESGLNRDECQQSGHESSKDEAAEGHWVSFVVYRVLTREHGL